MSHKLLLAAEDEEPEADKDSKLDVPSKNPKKPKAAKADSKAGKAKAKATSKAKAKGAAKAKAKSKGKAERSTREPTPYAIAKKAFFAKLLCKTGFWKFSVLNHLQRINGILSGLSMPCQ